MRPHRLRVSAFGAFGGTAEVCFDDLAAAGLFLLHGETGAGKTTLLDAIGFALYGRVPGERGKAKRLRSDHASAGTPTEVELEATIGGRRLRITRRPEQTRPKLRGDGFTTEQARILVEEREQASGSWHTVSTRAGEADTEIADLMGMSAEQFFQVVLLPQGQFAQFLQANAEERAKLLQRLFGTDRFRAVEEWLADRRRTTAHEVAEAEQQLAQLAARTAQVASVPMPEGTPEPGWAAQLATVAAAESAAAAARVTGCRESLDAAQQRHRAAERLADRQRRRAAALRKRDELTAAEPRVAQSRRDLDAAQRAAEVAPALTATASAATALERARAAEQRTRARCALPAATATELRDAGQQRQQQVGHLEALRSVADQAAAEEAQATAASKAATSLTAQAETLRTGLARHRQRREAVAVARDAARSAAVELPGVRAEADRYRRAADDAAALAVAQTEVARHQQAHLTARERAVGLREEASRLREARIDGMRAELAATLTDGDPCPVCGSLDHPELCELRDDRVTREQEEAATAAADTATAQAETVGKQLAAAQTRVADLTDRLTAAGFGAAQDPLALSVAIAARSVKGSLAHTAAALTERVAALSATAATLGQHETGLEKLDQAIADGETRLAALTQQHAAELDKAQAARERAATHHETLRAQLGGQPDLDAALSAVRAAADALTAAADAADATIRADEEADRARQLATQAAANAGFANTGAARTAQRDAAWRTTTGNAIREYEKAVASVTDQLASADLDVPLEPLADVAEAAHAAKTAGQAHDDAVATRARAQRKAEQLDALAPKLTAQASALRPLAERAAETRRLADLAAGQGANTLRMTLSSFVLAARLEEVAAAASQRLLRMTSGRYSLRHTDSRRGGGRSGLGLLACDAWTGADRDTSTLSGGETFMASLALALGLADVVTQEAGGARIEALFVDEGFGSLDEQTLEEVMNVLDGLREGGRCVGIVSHVAELRQRIPAQIRVRKTHSGSSITVMADATAN